MLKITVSLISNGRERDIAVAEIGIARRNVTFDYGVRAVEGANPVSGNPEWRGTGMVEDYDHEQPVWRLVEKAAKWAADEIDRENTPTIENKP